MNIALLKQRISNHFFYERELKIESKKSYGWTCGGLCPFHQDKNIGSFWINFDRGSFNCFSCNSKGGDIIDFTCLKYELSISQAIKRLIHEYL